MTPVIKMMITMATTTMMSMERKTTMAGVGGDKDGGHKDGGHVDAMAGESGVMVGGHSDRMDGGEVDVVAGAAGMELLTSPTSARRNLPSNAESLCDHSGHS